MCGIAGFIHHDPTRRADIEALRRMTDVAAHRGPDGEGFYINANVALGHRRLAIIDLESGTQPMSCGDGSVTVSFNGEIYNYVELREELRARGHQFRTDSDTEVIIEAYREWGLECQTRFNGMWSFALWDENLHRLLLSRDRLGEKPLHYAQSDETLVFASEMKSLFAWGVDARQDRRWTEVFAFLTYLPAPHTFYACVSKLPAGHCLIWEAGETRISKYWDLPEFDERRMRTDAPAIESEFSELFADAVRIRMRSDVPFGAFLSGGLDSSCIVATMAAISPHAVRTFTIGFDEARYDERPLARLVAAAFHTEHHEEVVAPDALDEAIARISYHYDEPFGDASAIPTGHVSRCARGAVKMALTGDGGDEALSGYTMYQGEKFAARYQAAPRAVRSIGPDLASLLLPALRGTARRRLLRARNVLRASSQNFDQRLIDKLAWGDIGDIRDLLVPTDSVAIGDFIADIMRGCTYRDPFYRLMYYHLKISLPDRMLVKVDRMSMAHSLEVRAPFLDHRLIELLVPVHKDVKMRGLERKSILRRTVAKHLPRQLLKAPKKGFAVPLGAWFRGGALSTLSAGLAAEGGITLRADPLQAILRRNQRGEENLGNLLWALMILDRFYRGASPPDAGTMPARPSIASR